MFDELFLKRHLASDKLETRRAAVAALSWANHEPLILEIAAHDADAGLRMDAAAKIADMTALAPIAAEEQNPEAAALMRRVLDAGYSEAVLGRDAVGAEEFPELDQIGGVEALADVAVRARHSNLTLAAAAKLRTQPDVLLRVLEKITDDATAVEIFSWCAPDDNALAQLLCHAKSEAVRQLAHQARVATPSPEAQPPDPALELVAAIEALEAEPDEAGYEKLLNRWRSEGIADSRLEERFLAARFRCFRRLEAARIAAAERLLAANELAVLQTRLAALPPDSTEQRARGQYEKLLNDWRSLTAKFPAVATDAPDFETRLTAWEVAFTERVELEKTVLAELTETVAAMEKLLAEPVREAGKKLKGELLAAFEAAAARLPGAAPLAVTDLKQRLLHADREYSRRLAQLYQERDLERWEHYTLKMDICLEIERLATLPETELGAAAKSFGKLRERYFTLGGVPQEKFGELKQRYQQASATLQARLSAFFEAREAQWQAGEAAKLAICTEAEALAASEDWNVTAERLKALQSGWKEQLSTRPARERELFNRFRAACDNFFNRRNQAFEERKKAFKGASDAKKALCVAVEALAELPFAEARRRLGELRSQWKELPFAGREDRELFTRFNHGADRIFSAYHNEKDNLRKQLEIVCTAMTLLAEKAETTAPELDELEKEYRDNCRQWRELPHHRDDHNGEVARRRDAAAGRVEAVLARRRRERTRHALVEQRQKERLSGMELAATAAADHLARRQKVCEELENRLVESGAEFGKQDLASALTLAISGNFGGRQAELNAAELDEFIRRFMVIGQVAESERDAIFDRFEAACAAALKFLEKHDA